MRRKPMFFMLFILIVFLGAVSAPAQNLSIDADTAARMAVQASALTVAATGRVEASVSAVKAADAARLPIVSANATVVRRSSVPEFGVPSDDPEQPVYVLFPNIENTYSADLSVSQPIYAGGGIAAGREGARLELQAADWAQNRTTISLRYSARLHYWQAVATSAGLDVAKAQLKRTQRLLEDARALREAGMAVNANVFAAEARFAAAEVDVIRAQTEENKAVARLLSLLGLAPDTDLELVDAKIKTVPHEPVARTELEAEALGKRPELKIADAQIEGLGARARATKAARMPAVGLSAHWMLARPNQRYLPPVDETNDSWGITLGASWSFFDGGRTKEQVATVRAEQGALQADRDELERQIKLEVETARLELMSTLKAVASADASATAAAAWEEASSERYAAGLAMMSELLDAQADLSAAEVAQVRTRASAWIAESALRRAVGR